MLSNSVEEIAGLGPTNSDPDAVTATYGATPTGDRTEQQSQGVQPEKDIRTQQIGCTLDLCDRCRMHWPEVRYAIRSALAATLCMFIPLYATHINAPTAHTNEHATSAEKYFGVGGFYAAVTALSYAHLV